MVSSEVEFLVGLGADRAEAVGDVGPAERLEGFTRMAVPDRLLVLRQKFDALPSFFRRD